MFIIARQNMCVGNIVGARRRADAIMILHKLHADGAIVGVADFPGRLAVVGAPFLRADFVFAFPLGSAVRKQVNRHRFVCVKYVLDIVLSGSGKLLTD